MGSRTSHAGAAEGHAVFTQKSVLREYAELILTFLLFVVFARAFVVQQSEIPSGSMEDTILIGDYILVNRFVYAPAATALERTLLPLRAPERGDIIVFKHPPEPERDFIKRVIGLPGDTVEVRRGIVHVNGVALDEPYINELYRAPDDFGPITVDDDSYFVMGDHRNRSADSREWGLVDRRLVKGRAFAILFSTGAPPPPGTDAETVTVTSLFRKLYNLAFHSRWDRALRLIR